MCRLFGFRSNVPSRAHRSLVEAENALSWQAERHQDGWGIGYFLGREAYIVKSETGAADDERFRRITSRLQSHTFVVHVRRATVGSQDYLNSHPFRHGAWMFAHNGTLFGFDEALRDPMLAATRADLRELVFGSTDSEHLFYYLVSALSEAGVSDDGRAEIDIDIATAALRRALSRVYRWATEAGFEPPIANYILTNGTVLFGQRAGLDLWLASQKIVCRDFATCPEPNKTCMDVMRPLTLLATPGVDGLRKTRPVNHLLVASEPIGDEDIWEEIPNGRMVVLNQSYRLSLHAAPDDFVPHPNPPVSLRSEGQGPAIGRGN